MSLVDVAKQNGGTTVTPIIPKVPMNDYSSSSFMGQNFLFDNSKGKLGQLFNKNNFGGTAQIASMFTDTLGSALGVEQRQYNSTIGAAKNIGNSIMQKVNPTAAAVNKVSDFASSGIAGIFGKSTNYSDSLSQGFDAATDYLNYLGPWGMAANFALDTINALTGTEVQGVQKSEKVQQSSSYTGTADKSREYGDRTFGGVGRIFGADSKYRDKVVAQQWKDNRADFILTEGQMANDANAYNSKFLNQRAAIRKAGGMQQGDVKIGAKGIKLFNGGILDRTKQILAARQTNLNNLNTVPQINTTQVTANPKAFNVVQPKNSVEKPKETIDIKEISDLFGVTPKHKEGGIIENVDITNMLELFGTQKFAEGGKMNVIPEGALHARLHHMDQGGITKKGIPVITEENDEIIQHAEIERNEIIFTKEVTEKLEKLYKDGSDEAAIEAGKLIATQIMEFTIDNTGLIEELCQQK